MAVTAELFKFGMKTMLEQRIKVLEEAKQTETGRDVQENYIPIRLAAYRNVLADLNRLSLTLGVGDVE
jgi:hypothetical protein